jgi:1-acyl-sn-glycerol-3-phosphate acyltransferase
MLKEITSRFFTRVTPWITRFWIKDIQGIENMHAVKGPCVIIANHASYLDFIILGTIFLAVFRSPVYFWANLKVVNHPLFRFYAKFNKSIPIDGENPGVSFFQRSIALIRERQSIAIFPEGTRSRSGELGEFHMGYLRLAYLAKVPVIPIYLRDTYEILPPHKKMPRFKRCSVVINPPITISRSLTKNDLESLNRDIFLKYYFKNGRG